MRMQLATRMITSVMSNIHGPAGTDYALTRTDKKYPTESYPCRPASRRGVLEFTQYLFAGTDQCQSSFYAKVRPTAV